MQPALLLPRAAGDAGWVPSQCVSVCVCLLWESPHSVCMFVCMYLFWGEPSQYMCWGKQWIVDVPDLYQVLKAAKVTFCFR